MLYKIRQLVLALEQRQFRVIINPRDELRKLEKLMEPDGKLTDKQVTQLGEKARKHRIFREIVEFVPMAIVLFTAGFSAEISSELAAISGGSAGMIVTTIFAALAVALFLSWVLTAANWTTSLGYLVTESPTLLRVTGFLSVLLGYAWARYVSVLSEAVALLAVVFGYRLAIRQDLTGLQIAILVGTALLLIFVSTSFRNRDRRIGSLFLDQVIWVTVAAESPNVLHDPVNEAKRQKEVVFKKTHPQLYF